MPVPSALAPMGSKGVVYAGLHLALLQSDHHQGKHDMGAAKERAGKQGENTKLEQNRGASLHAHSQNTHNVALQKGKCERTNKQKDGESSYYPKATQTHLRDLAGAATATNPTLATGT